MLSNECAAGRVTQVRARTSTLDSRVVLASREPSLIAQAVGRNHRASLRCPIRLGVTRQFHETDTGHHEPGTVRLLQIMNKSRLPVVPAAGRRERAIPINIAVNNIDLIIISSSTSDPLRLQPG